MEITFQGNKPQKKTYSYSVKENNNSNIITFILNKEIEGLDLSSLSCYVKVKGSEIDKDVPTIEVEGEQIKINWTLQRKHTISRMLLIQLQFEGAGDIVWQSEIVEIVLSDTIKADQYIENKYPSVLTNHEGRIITLEEKAIEPSDYYTKDETDDLLDDKQDLLTFDNVPTENSDNPVKSGGVYASLQNVIEIAEGKSQSFTLSYETEGNEAFNSQEGSIELGSFTDINGNVIDTTKLKVGDIILITQINVPDRWVGNIQNGVATFYRMETAKVDLTAYYTKAESDQKYVDLTSEQTISGTKNFIGGLKTTVIDLPNNAYIRANNTNVVQFSSYTMKTYTFFPIASGSYDIGTANYKYRNIYFNGELRDGTNSMSVSDIANSTFNVINASDIVSNTLTQAQYDLITNGKPTLINGTLSGQTNIFIPQVLSTGSVRYASWFNGIAIGSLTINVSTKVITILGSATKAQYLRSIYSFNGKEVPNYPTDTTKQYKLVQQVGGTLAFSEDKEEIIIRLNTGTYTNGTSMSDNDRIQWQTILNLSFENLISKKIKFVVFLTDRGETILKEGFSLSTTNGEDWVVLSIIIDSLGRTLNFNRARMTNGTY